MIPAPQRTNACIPIRDAFKRRAIDAWVEGCGRVRKVLADDNEGSRHQRFILEIKGGVFTRPFTLLVAHNIDLTGRVPLKEGDKVRFRGQYKWTEQGGTLHWTHHDPGGWHDGGWIKRGMKRYA